jgi:hypothetical protein
MTMSSNVARCELADADLDRVSGGDEAADKAAAAKRAEEQRKHDDQARKLAAENQKKYFSNHYVIEGTRTSDSPTAGLMDAWKAAFGK